MNKKELIKIIKNFKNLNPKTSIYPKVNKELLNDFLIVKDLFKNNLQQITQSNYDNIFSDTKGEFLLGQRWIKILTTSKNIDDYYTNLRHVFIKCNQKKLQWFLIDDLFRIYYHD